jgi:hypothetical protein
VSDNYPNDYLGAMLEAHQQGYDFTSIADYHASQGWDNPPQPDMGTLLAGDVVPMGQGSALAPFGAPGFTGAAVQQMLRNVAPGGGSDYYAPNQSVTTGSSTLPTPVNENEP